jgi:hypothetical protein
VVDLKKNLCRGKDSMALKITKAQYAHLIREISDALKDDIQGGGMYDFAAPEVYSEHPMSQVKFWVADGSMPGVRVAIWNFVGMWTVSGWGYGM